MANPWKRGDAKLWAYTLRGTVARLPSSNSGTPAKRAEVDEEKGATKMRISTQEFTRVFSTETPTASPMRRAYAATQSTRPVGDAAEVQVSTEAQDVQYIKAQMAEAPDVREAMIAELKAKIDAGEYKISGEDIADSMIRRAHADNIR